MTKIRNNKIKRVFFCFIFMAMLFFLLTTNSKAAVSVTRNIYSNNGSMKFNFTGLTLDTTHEYEYGLTKTAASQVTNWFLLTEYTKNTAVVDLITTTEKIREVINAVDTAYLTIKDKTTGNIIVSAYKVNLKIPYLRVADESVLPNGREFSTNENNNINIALRNADNSIAYYQYVPITEDKIINKYKEIKANKTSIFELEPMLTTKEPTNNWKKWEYWNGYTGMGGYGYPSKTINVPDSGLYYLWIYFAGKDIKNVYGYILVDNLTPDIAVNEISLKGTATVSLNSNLQLTPTITPSNATNKIITWSSSNEEIASVNNAGLVTAKKVGSAIITATTQDGNKKATCTITVANTVAPTGIALNKTAVTMNKKETLQLTSTITPSNANNKNVIWISSDTTIAIVDANGKITALKAGTATITAKTEEGDKTATCVITVKETGANTNINMNQNGGKDDTVAPTKIPQTGVVRIFIFIILAGISAVIFGKLFFKYREIK